MRRQVAEPKLERAMLEMEKGSISFSIVYSSSCTKIRLFFFYSSSFIRVESNLRAWSLFGHVLAGT